MSSEARVALVTGASGDLGIAISEALVRVGFRVHAQYHTRVERLTTLRTALGERGPSLRPVRADLTRESGVRDLVGAVAASDAGLDLLVNAAGGARPASLGALSASEWGECLALNLTASFLCVREALALLKVKRGQVLNISSVAGFTGGAFGAHYAASKAGVIGLTRSLARELGRDGIRVNAIAPGPVDSAMTSSLASSTLESLLATTALGRVVAPEEIASTVVTFATGLTAVTGQTLVIDGGRLFH